MGFGVWGLGFGVWGLGFNLERKDTQYCFAGGPCLGNGALRSWLDTTSKLICSTRRVGWFRVSGLGFRV